MRTVRLKFCDDLPGGILDGRDAIEVVAGSDYLKEEPIRRPV